MPSSQPAGFSPDLKILPSQRTMILGCVDPRVDPMDVLKLQPGEAAIIRNVGGRVKPIAARKTMELPSARVSKAGGEEMGQGWNLVLASTHQVWDQGLLSPCAPPCWRSTWGFEEADLDKLEINDPLQRRSAIDVAALRDKPRHPPADSRLPASWYDVDTGFDRHRGLTRPGYVLTDFN